MNQRGRHLLRLPRANFEEPPSQRSSLRMRLPLRLHLHKRRAPSLPSMLARSTRIPLRLRPCSLTETTLTKAQTQRKMLSLAEHGNTARAMARTTLEVGGKYVHHTLAFSGPSKPVLYISKQSLDVLKVRRCKRIPLAHPQSVCGVGWMASSITPPCPFVTRPRCRTSREMRRAGSHASRIWYVLHPGTRTWTSARRRQSLRQKTSRRRRLSYRSAWQLFTSRICSSSPA